MSKDALVSISKARCDQPVTAFLQRDPAYPTPKTHACRYLIEIKDAKGVVLFSSAAYWGDKDKGLGIAQIKGLIGLPAVNFYAEYALGPDPLQEPVEWRPRSTRAANFEHRPWPRMRDALAAYLLPSRRLA